MNAARTLRTKRRKQRWNDKRYKKKNFGAALKANPLGGASHAKGIVLEKMYTFTYFTHTLTNFSGIEAKQPNSAIRKAVRVQLIKNGKKVTAFVPMDGCLLFIEENVCKI